MRLWLGTENFIISVKRYRYGLKVTDATTATYRQPDFPEGLKVSSTASGEKVLTDWSDILRRWEAK